MKVELESGVWLADGQGDPTRTLKEENAKEFNSIEEALKALDEARQFSSFVNASIEEDFFKKYNALQ